MHKSVLTAIVFAMGALGYAAQADADLISIGLQETGVNGGAITTETTGSAAATLGAISYATFRLNQATAQDTAGIGLPASLNSNSLTRAGGVDPSRLRASRVWLACAPPQRECLKEVACECRGGPVRRRPAFRPSGVSEKGCGNGRVLQHRLYPFVELALW
jgi:hypothetical protein